MEMEKNIRDNLKETFIELPKSKVSAIVEKLKELKFFDKSPEEMIESFEKLLSKNKIEICSVIYDIFLENKIITENIFPETTIKKMKIKPKWYNKNKHKLITDWSKINAGSLICSSYLDIETPVYFCGFDKGCLLLKYNQEELYFRMVCCDLWLLIK